MNQVTPEQKDSVTKTFAIVGFVAAILFAVWLAVQIVGVIPSAFSSLASIADGVYNYNEDQTLSVSTKNSVVKTGEEFTLLWSNMTGPGTYTFSYQCTEGVAATIHNIQKDTTSLDCATPLNMSDQTSLEISFDSEKQRFVDVTYTVVYVPTNESANEVKTNSQITIMNASVPTRVTEKTPNTEAAETTPSGEVAGESTTVETNTSDTGLTTGTPKTIEEIIYAIPTSDPDGDIDLQVVFLGVGTLADKVFTREATIDRDKQGAFQFSVENVGTKTSAKWNFEALLPSGIEYTSGPQVELKPAEKAIITIGFEGLTQLGTEKFGVTLDVDNDTNSKNNKFTWAVEVVK